MGVNMERRRRINKCLLIATGSLVTLVFIGMAVSPNTSVPVQTTPTAVTEYVPQTTTPQPEPTPTTEPTSTPTTTPPTVIENHNSGGGSNHVRLCVGHHLRICT
jgi:hypothetical protein